LWHSVVNVDTLAPRVLGMRHGFHAMIWLGAACAAAGNATTSDALHSDDAPAYRDAMPTHDAMQMHDAMPMHDAMQMHDAAVAKDAAVIEDAPGSGGELCADNTGCTDPGTCCYFFTCTLGAGVGSNLCFPSS
jgi:hypothetical protein